MLKVTNRPKPLAHRHPAKSTIAATTPSASQVPCSRPAAPVATTSNGLPPPESEFESWLLPAGVPVLVGAAVGSLKRNVVDAACDAVESIAMPPELEAAEEEGEVD